MRPLRLIALVLSLAASACNTYGDALSRSQSAFDAHEYERALSLLRELEGDLLRLAPPERARYAYLRGMTDLRIGHRADARHWLAIAEAYDADAPGTLPADWKARAGAALADLAADVR